MRFALASAIVFFSLVSIAAAAQTQCSIRQPIEIPAAALGTALQTLAKKCGYQIAYISEQVQPFYSNGVSGELTLEEALTRLLSGTGLTYSHSGENGLVIRTNVPSRQMREGTKTAVDSKEQAALSSIAVQPGGRSGQVRPAQAAPRRLAGRSDESIRDNAAPGPMEEAVITGSRVIKNGNESPTPVTVVPVDEVAVVHPGTVADQLNDMPQFSGSTGQQTNPGGGNANNGNPNPQANVLNLRNFGATRTLILFDGHRAAPTSPNGTVSVDMIPRMLLQRVDIVTGGASAVYGADAITGVVNFITDTHFNGLKVNAQGGLSVYGDEPTQGIGVAWGRDLFDGRGHVEASYEFRNDGGIARRSSRPYFEPRWTVYPVNNRYVLVPYATHTDKAFGGLITGGPLGGQYFAANGVLSPFVAGAQIGSNAFATGGNGSYFDTSLRAQLRMHQLFGRFDYDFSDAVHGYVKVAGSHNFNHVSNLWNLSRGANGTDIVQISATNAYLPAQYQAVLANAGVATFNFSKIFQDAPRQNSDTFERQYSIDTGLNVQLAGGYEWDIAFIHSANEQNVRQNANVDTRKFAASLDAVFNPANGQIVCQVSLTAYASLYPGCVPNNPFGPTSDSPEALSYFIKPTELTAYTTMDDVITGLTGSSFSTWSGPINVALSAEWRRLAYRLESSAVPNSARNPLDCTGLRFNCNSVTGQAWGQAGVSAERPPVSVSATEMALEFDAPLFNDVPLAKHVSLNGAARYTHYSTSGTVWSWKAGLDWQLSDSLTLRGTRSRDIRAPTLFELYQPVAVGSYNLLDYVTNVQLNGVAVASDGNTYQAVATYAQGNPLLRPEIANTITAGFVYQPEWAPTLSVSLDSFFIDLTAAITTFNGTNQTTQLACLNSGGASPLCQLIDRPISCCSTVSANSATAFYAAGVNVANQWTQGADLEVNYAGRWFDKPYSLRLLTTFQPHIVYATPGSGQVDTGGAAFAQGLQASPVWRASLFARYTPFENFTISVLARWRSRLSWGPQQTPPLVFKMPFIGSTAYTSLTLSYLFKHNSGVKTELYFNAQNLFNRKPPIAASFVNQQPGIFNASVIGDDAIGAYYTLGLRYRI